MTHAQGQHNHGWVHNSPYTQPLTDKSRTHMEQLSLNGTPEAKICYRCGYEGHIKRHCNNYVYCEYCRTYTHHTSVCRSYQRHIQAQLVTSSRRSSPAAPIGKNKYNRTEESQQQCQNISSKEEGLSEITRKHLEQIISSMIPTNHSTLNEGTTTTDKGDITKEPQDIKETEKKVVVNNFYIPNGEGGWKRLETGEILPVSPVISGGKSQNKLQDHKQQWQQ